MFLRIRPPLSSRSLTVPQGCIHSSEEDDYVTLHYIDYHLACISLNPLTQHGFFYIPTCPNVTRHHDNHKQKVLCWFFLNSLFFFPPTDGRTQHARQWPELLGA